MLELVEAGAVFCSNPLYIVQQGEVVAPHGTTDAVSAMITARLDMRGATNFELPRLHALNKEYRSLYYALYVVDVYAAMLVADAVHDALFDLTSRNIAHGRLEVV